MRGDIAKMGQGDPSRQHQGGVTASPLALKPFILFITFIRASPCKGISASLVWRRARRLRCLAPSRIWQRLRCSFPVKYILPPHLRLRRYWNNIIQRFLPMYSLSLQLDLCDQSPEFLPSYGHSHISSLEEACHLLASCMGVTKNTCSSDSHAERT